jgi:hypothetical protein
MTEKIDPDEALTLYAAAVVGAPRPWPCSWRGWA